MNSIAKIAVIASVVMIAATPALATDFTVVGLSNSMSMNYAKIEWTRSAGAMETGVVKFRCDGAAMTGAWLYAPRDVATGQASGKRMHKPFTIVKEWGAVSPGVAKGSWDLATGKGARSAGGGVMAMDDWTAITITGLDQACSSKLSNNPVFQESGNAGEMPVVR